jgi:hypothetical protein
MKLKNTCEKIIKMPPPKKRKIENVNTILASTFYLG